MNKDNKAIFENFAASRQQIVSEKGLGSNILRSSVAPGAQLMNMGSQSGNGSGLAASAGADIDRPEEAATGLDQFRQMEQDGTLADHIDSMSAEDAAAYMNEIKQEYDQRAEAEGLPLSDDPGSDFSRGEELARNLKPEYDNAKESIAARANVDPEAAGPELDFTDNEVAPVVRPDTDEDNWATRIGAEEIPPVPTGADTPNGGQPAEAPPAADISDVDVPGVTNTQNPNDPVVPSGNPLESQPQASDISKSSTRSPIGVSSAFPSGLQTAEDGEYPYWLTPDARELTNSLNNLDPEESPVSVQPLPEDPTISNTIDAGGDPTDPLSRDYTNNKDYAGTNEAPRQIAPEVPQTSDVPGQNASSAEPDNPFPKGTAAGNITGNPAIRSIAPPAAKPTSPPRSTGTGAFDWIKNGPAPSSQFDDTLKNIGRSSDDSIITPFPDSPSGRPMMNPYATKKELPTPATEEPELEDPTRPSPEELEQMERETGLRPSAEQEYDNAMADVGDVSTPGNEQWAYNKSGKQAEKKYYRDANRKFNRDMRTQGYKSIYNAQQKQLKDDAEAMKSMSLEDLYARRDALEKKQREQRKEQRARREERRADRAGRNKPKPDANGDIEGVDYQEPAARSAAEAEAQIQSGGRARELDRSRELQAQKAAQTKPNRPQSTPTPPATAQKPGIGRKLMSFLPGGEKPSEVFGKHAGREGANAAVRGTNHQKSFKDHNAEMNAQRQAKADEQAAKKQAAKAKAGTLGKTTTPPTSRVTDKKPPTVGQSSSATPADAQKKKGGFLSGFKVAKTPSTSRPGQGRFGRGVKR